MSEPLVFIIPGDPVGKGRPRVTRTGHVYAPGKTRAAEEHVKTLAMVAMAGVRAFEGPVIVSITAFYEVPASWPNLRQRLAISGAESPGKPDLDNVVKLVLDAINKTVFADDKLVVQLVARKLYGPDPHTRVTVEPMPSRAKAAIEEAANA